MKTSRTLGRHCVVLILATLATYLFLVVHSKWAPIHLWNRSFADTSLVLLAITMMLGPAARLWNTWNRLLPWRRQFGIYAVGFGAVHTLLVLDGWVEWDIPRVAGFLVHPALGGYVLAEHGFGLANVVGIIALLYGVILLTISNDYAVRRLGGSVWKFIQSGAYIMWALVVVHTAYFLFMHFLHFHRPLPDPNPLQWPFVGVVLAVIALQSVATLQTWRLRYRERVRTPSEGVP